MPNLVTTASTQTTSIKLGSRKPILQELAEETNSSVHNLILEAIDSHTQQLKAKINYDKLVAKSWGEYQETGLHITLDEFKDWVDSLSTDTPKDMPECHN